MNDEQQPIPKQVSPQTDADDAELDGDIDWQSKQTANLFQMLAMKDLAAAIKETTKDNADKPKQT